MRRRLRSNVLVALVLATVHAPAAEYQLELYRDSVPGYTNIAPFALNDSSALFWAHGPSGVGVYVKRGKIIKPLENWRMRAGSVNNQMVATGAFMVADGEGGDQFPWATFVSYPNGAYHTYSLGYYTIPGGINDHNVVVGGVSSGGEGVPSRPFMIDRSGAHFVSVPGISDEQGAWLYDINNRGAIVGGTGEQIFVWDTAGVRFLRLPGYPSWGDALRICDNGEVVGTRYMGSDPAGFSIVRGFICKPSGRLELVNIENFPWPPQWSPSSIYLPGPMVGVSTHILDANNKGQLIIVSTAYYQVQSIFGWQGIVEQQASAVATPK